MNAPPPNSLCLGAKRFCPTNERFKATGQIHNACPRNSWGGLSLRPKSRFGDRLSPKDFCDQDSGKNKNREAATIHSPPSRVQSRSHRCCPNSQTEQRTIEGAVPDCSPGRELEGRSRPSRGVSSPGGGSGTSGMLVAPKRRMSSLVNPKIAAGIFGDFLRFLGSRGDFNVA
jgi:hypothetical protein